MNLKQDKHKEIHIETQHSQIDENQRQTKKRPLLPEGLTVFIKTLHKTTSVIFTLQLAYDQVSSKEFELKFSCALLHGVSSLTVQQSNNRVIITGTQKFNYENYTTWPYSEQLPWSDRVCLEWMFCLRGRGQLPLDFLGILDSPEKVRRIFQLF